MPPQARITAEMIVHAALENVRREGPEGLNVRRVAAALSCSTQPVMYHFRTVQALKEAVRAKADALHTDYIMTPEPGAGNPLLSVGLRYIRFASEEPHLFRFLFQSGQFRNMSFAELARPDGSEALAAAFGAMPGLTQAQARKVFAVLFSCVHGAASLIANNSIPYDEAHFTELLTDVYSGVMMFMKENAHETVLEE